MGQQRNKKEIHATKLLFLFFFSPKIGSRTGGKRGRRWRLKAAVGAGSFLG
jgi:hypothetical protein